MTLVEVVVGITLLATLLVSILMSFRTHSTQVHGARDRMKAIQIADGLLSVWMEGSSFPSMGQQDALTGTPGWIWRIGPVQESDDFAILGGRPARLEIIASNDRSEYQVLTSVEFLIPAQESVVP